MDTVFSSPAVRLLLDLREAAQQQHLALSYRVTADGRLQIGPAAVLTPELRERIRANRDALRLLIQLNEAEVYARLLVFQEQLQNRTTPTALRYADRPPAGAAICESCGVSSDTAWCVSCQMAAHLALEGDLPLDWTPQEQFHPVSRPAELAH